MVKRESRNLINAYILGRREYLPAVFPSFLFTIMGGGAAFQESSGPHSTSINYHGRATPALGPCLENFGRNCTYINELVEHA